MAKEEALKKLEAEEVGKDMERFKEIIRLWVQYDDAAADLVLAEKKTCKGAFHACKKEAQKLQKNGYYEPDFEEMAEWILDYYGATDSKGIVEGGFMYFICLMKSVQCRPYDDETANRIRTKVEALTLSIIDEPDRPEKTPKSEPVKPKPAGFTFDMSML